MFKKLVSYLPLVAAGTMLSAVSNAQLGNVGTSLFSHISLSTFGSSAGNGCWGYVSPSGREYALMGLNNKVAFVEVTNPGSPVVVATIPHSSSTWCDIKVYGRYAYAVTETAGTGIQVMDMDQIDTGTVTLVKTILSPGRTHTLALNATSGYLYTCGSRDGTGTSMCFSLLDPANPVQVGMNSLTTNYQHEATVVSYTSGPYAGREIWFGFSEGRGVDIYDVTDKNATFMIKRVTYPSMGYCHQGWLSADRKYLYVDDELDEQNSFNPMQTRSLIFNVETLETAFFVKTFTSGLNSIDHNQYVTDGFTFQANYRSGLRIFDLVPDPENPIQVGSFDTYLANDNQGFQGAWSNYPFFPSGTVVISDINDGLFVVDVTEATTRNVPPSAMLPSTISSYEGSLANVLQSDGSMLAVIGRPSDVFVESPLEATFTASAHDAVPNKIRLVVESALKQSIGGPGSTQTVELYDWVANAYVQVDQRLIGSTKQTIEVTAAGYLPRFVDSNLQVKARVRWTPGKGGKSKTLALIDKFQFRITR